MNHSARLAKTNQWGPGTTIQTTDKPAKTVILTYVSEQLVVGIDQATGEEKVWNLTNRSWRETW